MWKKRGFEFLSAIKYIKQTYGEEDFKTLLEQLPAEYSLIFKDKINAIGWYPADAHVKFMNSADKIYADGQHKICHLIGRFSAEEAAKGIFKYFLEGIRLELIFKSVGMFWKQLNSSGRLIYVESGNGYVKGRIVELVGADKCHCSYVLGFLERTLELLGVKNVIGREVKCACGRDEFCEFDLRWDEESEKR